MSLLLLFRGPPATPPRPSGGRPARGTTKRPPAPGFEILHALQRPKRLEDDESFTKREKAALAAIAAEQAELLRLDEAQRAQHAREELRLRGLEADTRLLAALNAERQRIIDLQIAILLHRKMRDDADVVALLLIAASLA